MDKPTHRVLTVLELLQANPRIGGAELAQRAGVDRRTVRRYVAHLEAIGIPIRAQRGRDGGYALMPGFKLPPMMFGADEALALSIGLRAAREIGLGELTPAVASAQAKLERVMPAKVRRRVRDVDQAVTFDLSRPFAAGANAALADLAAAARARQRVHLRYRAARLAETERDLDPYGVAYRAGAWYVVGYCHLRQDLRSFRLDRILSVVPLPKSFGRPEAFDVIAYLTESIASLPRAHAIEVELHADLPRARQAVFAAIGTVTSDGARVVLHAQADDLNWFARELSRLPFGFEIIVPKALRAALAAHGRALVACAKAKRQIRRT